MSRWERDGIWLGGFGSDIFGEHLVAQIAKSDPLADHLFQRYLQEYLQWHAANHHFHETMKDDAFKYKRVVMQKWGYTTAGFVFGATVVNPNFTHRQSYYLRRAWPVLFAMIGYQWGLKLECHHVTCTMLRMHDYLPLEVRRALQTKDFRHLQMFDWTSPGR